MGLLNWFQRRNQASRDSRAVGNANIIESLENRLLMHSAHVINAIGDNRGQVLVYVDETLQRNTLNRTNIKLFTAGPDETLNTSDDVNRNIKVGWNAAGKRIVIYATDLDADEEYRIKLFSTRIISTDGGKLDGEFSGTLPSGDGNESGYFEAKFLNDTSDTPLARIFTSTGNIALRLRGDWAPDTVDNFIAYANSRKYDGTFIHRNSRVEPGSTIDVLQGGAFYTNGNSVTTFAPIALEAGEDNLRGTISMARAADTSGTATATSSFFINITDNPELNENNGLSGWSQFGYAVFGTIASGLSVLDGVDALPTSALGGTSFFLPLNNGKPVVWSRVAIGMKLNAV